MLDKLKDFAERSKNVFLYVLAPIGLALFYVFRLIGKNRELETELKAKEGEEKLNELQGEQKQIDLRANDAVAEFERLRDRMRASSASGDGSDPGPKGPDSN